MTCRLIASGLSVGMDLEGDGRALCGCIHVTLELGTEEDQGNSVKIRVECDSDRQPLC
jgi:hypothetical protein